MMQKKRGRKKFRESVGASREELNRLNRILQTLCQCNHALVHAIAETELYQSVCQILVEVGGLRLAWVGHCEQDVSKTVRPVAIAGYRPDYVQNAKISWSEENERGRGPTGIALRTGKPCWVKGAKVDPILAPWRTEANARGYASCVALPLIANGKRLGCLSLYAGQRNAFNESTIDQYRAYSPLMPLLRHHLARFWARRFAITTKPISPLRQPSRDAKSGLLVAN